MSINFSKEFYDFVTEAIPVGQKWFSNENRKHVYRSNPEYYKLIDFDDDYVMLHPILMSHFIVDSNETHLDQLFFNFLKDQTEFKVRSNANGLIYLAGTGSLQTEIKNADLIVKKEGDDLVVFDGDTKIASTFTPIDTIPNTNIELPLFELPMARLSNSTDPEVYGKMKFDEISRSQRDNVIEACAILEREFPEFFHWLKITIRAFQIYDQPEIWSYASIGTFGISYFSASPERSVLFFLEDIIHQSAHNVLYAVNYLSKDELFQIPANSTLDDIMQDGDHRNIYGVFHGLFTQSNINIFFNRCLERELFEGELHHELIGRMADNMKRWKGKLEMFRKPGILSEIGQQYYDEFNDIYEQMYKKWGHIIDPLDCSNQPYIFSYAKFLEANPIKL